MVDEFAGDFTSSVFQCGRSDDSVGLRMESDTQTTQYKKNKCLFFLHVDVESKSAGCHAVPIFRRHVRNTQRDVKAQVIFNLLTSIEYLRPAERRIANRIDVDILDWSADQYSHSSVVWMLGVSALLSCAALADCAEQAMLGMRNCRI